MRLTLLIIVTCFFIPAFAGNWKLEKDKKGIKVYTRESDDSDFKEFKALATIKADRMKIAKVLTRVSDFMNWYPDVSESRVLKIISPTKRIIYYKVDVPWPADDRDVVLNFNVKTDNKKKETLIYMDENLNTKSEVLGVVRMKKAEGFWKLTSVGNHTKVHYQFLGDPGGGLPSWLVNMFIVDGPYDTIIALKEKVE